jgi:hypothetical protein
LGKPGEERGREGERGAGWENGREGDREEEKRQMRFKRNGNTRRISFCKRMDFDGRALFN